MHFKICGITTIEDADLALEAGASAIGLNLVPASLRAIDTETAGRITVHVGARALVVLVVADESLERMQELVRVTGARCLQLHGDETPELVERVLPHAYKAIRVASLADVERAVGYPGEHLLVDAKVEGKLGGTGKTLDWSLVEPLARAQTHAGRRTPRRERRRGDRAGAAVLRRRRERRRARRRSPPQRSEQADGVCSGGREGNDEP